MYGCDKNGVPQGAMNDNGWVSGSVYDTYTGIASAKQTGVMEHSSRRTHIIPKQSMDYFIL